MRRLGLVLVLILGACGSGQAPAGRNEANAARTAPSAPPAAPAAPVANAAANEAEAVPNDDPGLAGLSPAQRRAYELGYRDCSHGRYAPANHLEAYRIGCGAAHDRIEDGRPQG